MSAVRAEKHYSVAEYLALEENAKFKSEYYDGEIFSMAGRTLNHNRIAGNIYVVLKQALKTKDFDVFMSDVKLHISSTNSFAYPDILVIKGEPDYWQNRHDTVNRAELIIEILSKSTQDYDRADKFENYRSLPELQDYILISQDKIHVEHFEKQASYQWLLSEYKLVEESFRIAQIEENINLAEIYEKIIFEN